MNKREIAPIKQKLNLTIALPGSKSITNRAFLCAGLASGKSKIYGALKSDDTQVMLKALKQMGVGVRETKKYIEIRGTGGQFKKGGLKLDLHNAGTATRFLTAISILRDGETVITGDKRMQERPIGDLAEGLVQLGATVKYLKSKGYPPISVRGSGSEMMRKNLQMQIPDQVRNDKFLHHAPHTEHLVKMRGNKSSQYFSALLMLGPMLDKPLKIEVIGELVSKPYIDTTLAVMKAFGVKVKNHDYKSFEVKPQQYQATEYEVEGDASAATYFSALNFLHGGTLKFENLNYPSDRVIRAGKKSIQGDVNFPEMLKKLRSKGPRVIDMSAMPDAAMTLAICAVFAKGETKITGLSTLKIKETDRLKALETELRKVGVKVKTTKDSIIIYPLVRKNFKIPGSSPRMTKFFRTTTIQTYKDHRMAMCFAVLGTKIPGIVIEDPSCTEKTYPNFWQDLVKAYLTPLDLNGKHLVLTGMRGAGKTYYGKKIAKKLNRQFIDTDEEIEKGQGMTIWEMVRKKGWGYFRELEQNFCSRITIEEKYSKTPLVIATGGGCVLNPENMKHLKQNAVNVFIFADHQVLTQRVMGQKFRPPLKKGQKAEEEIGRLWEDRRPLYLKYADVVWDDTDFKVLEEYWDS